MDVAVAYYPEHNKPEQWKIDLELMKEAGIKRIRVAEFAWSQLEPMNGRFEWEWLDRFMDETLKSGMEIILCTPTACPPIWLVEQFPDVIPVNEEGRRNVFGARQHRCYHSPAYILYSLRIVEKMALRYGNHPSVAAWQLDNEFGGEQKRCYCDHCKQAFQAYLEEEYHTIEELNERWGNVFWSMDYHSFDQIDTPLVYKADLGLKMNPSKEMEFTRFSSDTIVQYSRKQIEFIRRFDATHLITTNRFGMEWGENVNWVELVRDLDAAGMDLYSEKLYEIAFYADFNESLKPGQSWFLEYGPSVSNLREGMQQLKGRGCTWFTLFKFKPFPFGQEQSLQEMVTLTGKPTESYRTIQTWAQEQDRVPDKLEEGRFDFSGIGLYFNFDSSWAYTISRWGHLQERMRYPNYLIETVYQSIYREDKAHRIVTSPVEIAGLHTLIVPLHMVYDAELEQALLNFVENGGRLLVTSDLFQKNKDNVYLNELPVIYSQLFELDSFYALQKREDAVICRVTKGKGQAIMMHAESSLSDWKEIMEAWVYDGDKG